MLLAGVKIGFVFETTLLKRTCDLTLCLDIRALFRLLDNPALTRHRQLMKFQYLSCQVQLYAVNKQASSFLRLSHNPSVLIRIPGLHQT